jgi:hypothetical protein
MKRFQTDRRLWLIASVVAFVALGFVNFEDTTWNADHTLWGAIWVMPTHPSLPDEHTMLLGYAVMLVIPAAMVGWLIQAVAVMTRSKPAARNA